MRWLWPVALTAAASTGAFLLAGIALAAMDPTVTTIGTVFVGGAVAALSAGLGLAVARRAPRNVVGVLLVVVGLMVAFTAARYDCGTCDADGIGVETSANLHPQQGDGADRHAGR